MPKNQYSKWTYLENVTRVKEIEQRHLCDVFFRIEEFCFCLHTQTRVVTLKECNNSNAKISISSNLTSFFFSFANFVQYH